MIYLASPYSHPDPAYRRARFWAAAYVTGRLMAKGSHVISPIAHTHPVAMAGALNFGWEHWAAYDEELIKRCDTVMVLQIEGWAKSVGIKAEMEIAMRRGKLVVPMDPDSVGLHYRYPYLPQGLEPVV
jgi:hypothetical protein